MVAHPAVLGLGAVLGAVLGSFSGTLALRAAAGRSALTGRSACDSCGLKLGFAATAPIWSYVRLRGRCGSCGAPIDPGHLVGELAGAVSGATIAALAPAVWTPLALTGVALLFVALFDLRRLRIPDAASLTVALSGIAGAIWLERAVEAVLTGIVAGLFLLAAAETFRRARGRTGLGLGDVKLVAALAIWTGPTLAPLGVALAAGLALALGSRSVGAKGERLAFGPYIAAAFWPLILGGLAA